MRDMNAPTSKTTTARTRSRYTGPTAARIAELIAPQHRVRFEQGWFWTAAVCHESEQDQDLMSFRQRPDGDGIDVRCKSAGCRRERMIKRLETLTREPIWSAYGVSTDADRSNRTETATEPPASASTSSSNEGRERNWNVILLPFVLLLAAPLAMGFDLQVVVLNAFGFGWAGWLVRRVVLSRRFALAKAARKR